MITLLAYLVLRQARGRRATRVLVGLGLVGLVYALARAIDLEYTAALLGSVSPWIGLAFLVLFQTEIRRALMDLGGVFWWRYSGRRRLGPYEDVVLAANRLSQQNTGALMVIERRAGLRTHIESGVRVDAKLSFHLLTTIFTPDGPFHDGAVIIQNDRIAAAACFLPLSTTSEHARELGSRHRAALGVTEETDAVAVVVAEKTGIISLAVNGVMESGLNEDQLRTRLSILFGRGARARRGVEIPRPATRPITAPEPSPQPSGLRVVKGGAAARDDRS
jgi:diadenylate cyclase